ncbi:MAG: hypothetical protein M3456_06245 [Actinomycetota bacterium]|nr:hypothetical protein [Actinomycetota bacterium]
MTNQLGEASRADSAQLFDEDAGWSIVYLYLWSKAGRSGTLGSRSHDHY